MTFTFKSAKLFFDQASLDLVPNKTSSSEVLYVDFNSTKDQNRQRFQIFIHPKKEVTLKKFELRFSVPLSPNTTVHSNGFLPNHRSGTYQLSDKLSGRGWLSTKTPILSRCWIYWYAQVKKKQVLKIIFRRWKVIYLPLHRSVAGWRIK